MAASVLLSAESPGPTFAVGSTGLPGVPGNGPGAAGPASWNRSLDRALDEAAATGCLNLSGRKLKEFPRSAANHDLSDTTRADLSRNRLPELPVEVCMFVSLENLNLYQNCLRSLPDSLLNLQALTYLNISRNQLTTLPAPVCSLPLKVLIACNNKLVSLPEELGQLRQLTELDVSCNEIQTLPPQVGQLEALRDLNIRRNHLARLPPELAELPLVRLDFSCNKVTSIPVCYRNLRHLQSIVLDNNPLQSPPAQCGGVVSWPTVRSPGLWFQQRGQRGQEVVRQRVEAELEQIDFIDSCAGEEEDEEGRSRVAESVSLSSQFMAYMERRITREGSLGKSNSTGHSRTDDPRRHNASHNRSLVDGVSAAPSTLHNQRVAGAGSGAGVERVRREAQLAAQRYEEERQRARQAQREAVISYVKHKATQSPTKLSPTESESVYPSRHSTHTDDSALFMGEERPPLSPTALQSPSYPGPVVMPSCRGTASRPDSFLFRLSQREERKRGDSGAPRPESDQSGTPHPQGPVGEEAKLVEQLRKNIESRLKVTLPSDLGAALTDGVVLCHLANHVRPRSVPSIHVPSPAVPKLTMAKCRRNVENFLEACRRIGVPQTQLCLPLHILEETGLPQVAGTVRALLDLAPPKHSPSISNSTATPVTMPGRDRETHRPQPRDTPSPSPAFHTLHQCSLRDSWRLEHTPVPHPSQPSDIQSSHKPLKREERDGKSEQEKRKREGWGRERLTASQYRDLVSVRSRSVWVVLFFLNKCTLSAPHPHNDSLYQGPRPRRTMVPRHQDWTYFAIISERFKKSRHAGYFQREGTDSVGFTVRILLLQPVFDHHLLTLP
ncbi:hypothetical protein JZ751_001920, partial [Albula glossodonta]